MRRRTAPVLAGLLCLTVTPLMSSGAPAAQAAPRYQEYVALGDSWSADVVFFDTNGLPDSTHAPVDCFQSRNNYPKIVARTLKVKTFRDATCGSATTRDFTQPQGGLQFGGVNAPQFDRLTKKTDLVTVGIGGNDAGIASAALTCISASPVDLPLPVLPVPDVLPLFDNRVLPTGGCKSRFTAGGVDELAENIKTSEIKVVRALQEIHRRSPKARVLLVNYLDAIPKKGCWPIVPVTDGDMAYLNSVFTKLNAMLARAAKRGKAELVDTHPLSKGHGVCAAPTDRYVEGLGIVSVNDLAVAVPAHPNAAGARSQAKSVLAKIKR